MQTPQQTQVLILCGGNGVRLRHHSDYVAKGMVKIGARPMLWHIMKSFSIAGFTKFVLALGPHGDQIRDYFANSLQHGRRVQRRRHPVA